MGRLLSIQYLRAFAALAVVVYHAMRSTQPAFSIGAAGVDVFFVISGFILWTIARERPITAVTFLKRRWERVVPLYWGLTLLVVVLTLIWPNLFWDSKLSPRHVLLSLAFVQHFRPDGQPFPVIVVGWTLNYEAIFYLAFAASLLAPARFRIWVLTALVALVPAFGIFVYRPSYILIANMLFFQFVAGVWVAEARLRGWLPKRQAGLVLAWMGAVIFALYYGFGVHDGLWRPFIWGLPAVMIVLGVVSIETDGGVRTLPVLSLLGDASYSIYLAHFVAIELLSNFLNPSGWLFVVVGITAGVASGLVCYWLLERPLLGLFHRRRLAVLPCEAT